MLVDYGADIEALDVAGRTPLYTAALYGRSLMAKVIYSLPRLLPRRDGLWQILIDIGPKQDGDG